MRVNRREFVASSACLTLALAASETGWSNGLLETEPEEFIALLTSGTDRMAFTPATRYSPYMSKIVNRANIITWVQVDLGASQSIDMVKLYPAFALGVGHRIGYGFPVRFKVEASEDPTFTTGWTILDHTNADFPNPNDRISSFPAYGKNARYVRLTGTRLARALKEGEFTLASGELGSGYFMGLSKMSVLSNGVDIAVHQPVAADEMYGNQKSLEQLTRAPRPMGEGIVTDYPENVTPVSRWKPPVDKVITPVKGVTLQGGVFQTAMENNIAYLLNSFSVDHMLQPFRERAGKSTRPGTGPQVPFWDTDLPGSNAGRFLMGAGNTLRWIDHPELRNRMNAIVDGIAECRESNGYIMAYPESTIFYSERGAYTRAWVTHGLIEAGYAGNPKAFELLRGYYDWFDQRPYLANLLRGAIQGNQGMIANTRMYFTPVGKPEDIQVIQRFFQENYWLEGLANRNELMVWQYPYDRPHCYLLTDFEAYMDLYRATGDPEYLHAMQGGWELYHHNWVNTGGSISIIEFQIDPPQSYSLNQKLGELCGSSFWTFLTQRFHRLYPEEEKYITEIEKSIYNVAMASQDGTQGLRYHTRLVDQKEQPTQKNTCCEGQGTRLLGSIPEHIYSIAPDGVYVNLFTPSTIQLSQGDQSMQLRMMTEFPLKTEVQLLVSTSQPVQSKLRIRTPSWAASEMQIRVNDVQAATGKPGTYVTLDRTWNEGDRVAFILPARLSFTRYAGSDQIPGQQRYALEYGPILMALMGSLDTVLQVREGQKPEDILAKLKPLVNQPLHFAIDQNAAAVYKPYWLVADETFTCFPAMMPTL